MDALRVPVTGFWAWSSETSVSAEAREACTRQGILLFCQDLIRVKFYLQTGTWCSDLIRDFPFETS